MGFHLTDLGNDERVLVVNFWNWRPTVELIGTLAILDRERLELMQTQFGGAQINKLEARRIGEAIHKRLLGGRSEEDARVTLGLQITREPDEGTFYRGDDWSQNYSATIPWLRKFTSFCLTCQGFEVI